MNDCDSLMPTDGTTAGHTLIFGATGAVKTTWDLWTSSLRPLGADVDSVLPNNRAPDSGSAPC